MITHFCAIDSLIRKGTKLTILGFVLALWTTALAAADPYAVEKLSPKGLSCTLKKKHPEYASIRWGVEFILSSNQHNLIDWAAEFLEAEPKTAGQVMLKIDVLLRVGLDRHAAKAVPLLKPFYPDATDPLLIKNAQALFQVSCDEFHAFHTAFAVCETFPQHAKFASKEAVAQVVGWLRLEGWTKEERDQWLTKMEMETPRELVFGKARERRWETDHIDHPGSVWFYLRFRARNHGEEREDFLSQLKEDIETHPDDSLKAYYFLVLWKEVSRNDKTRGHEPLWLVETVQPKTCRDAYALARYLIEVQRRDAAQKMLQKAKALLDETEKTSTTPENSRKMTPQEKKGYKSAIQELLKRYSSSSRSASSFAYDKPVSSTSTASSTGMKGKKNAPKTDDPEYWWRQGNSYLKAYRQNKSGEAFRKAEEAFKKGLEMTDPISWPTDKKKRRNCERVRGLLRTHYICLLSFQQRYEESFQLLYYDLKNAPLESQLAKDAAMYLSHGPYRNLLKPDNPAIWNWLEKTRVWSGRETRLLDAIAIRIRDTNRTFSLDNEAPETVYAFVERVEAMAVAKDADPSRMEYCIKILLFHSPLLIQPNSERIIPLLDKRLQRKDLNPTDRREFGLKLLNAYLKGNYLDKADALLKDPANRLNYRGSFVHLAQLAIQNGRKDLAMRYWRRSANCALLDGEQIHLSRILRQNGLGNEIDAYYKEVKKKLPDFVPVEVLWKGSRKSSYAPPF